MKSTEKVSYALICLDKWVVEDDSKNYNLKIENENTLVCMWSKNGENIPNFWELENFILDSIRETQKAR